MVALKSKLPNILVVGSCVVAILRSKLILSLRVLSGSAPLPSHPDQCHQPPGLHHLQWWPGHDSQEMDNQSLQQVNYVFQLYILEY